MDTMNYVFHCSAHLQTVKLASVLLIYTVASLPEYTSDIVNITEYTKSQQMLKILIEQNNKKLN
mgnify:CR=1 FL=1